MATDGAENNGRCLPGCWCETGRDHLQGLVAPGKKSPAGFPPWSCRTFEGWRFFVFWRRNGPHRPPPHQGCGTPGLHVGDQRTKKPLCPSLVFSCVFRVWRARECGCGRLFFRFSSSSRQGRTGIVFGAARSAQGADPPVPAQKRTRGIIPIETPGIRPFSNLTRGVRMIEGALRREWVTGCASAAGRTRICRAAELSGAGQPHGEGVYEDDRLVLIFGQRPQTDGSLTSFLKLHYL